MSRFTRILLTALVLGAIGFAGWRGWQWRAQLECRRIVVEGTRHAAPVAIKQLVGVDTSQALYDIDPLAVADSVRRHPWVRDAEVARRPSGTLAITVTERRPVALALSPEGKPSHYLDADGYRMPADVPGPAYDVPLLRGATSYHPRRPVEQASVRALLQTLDGLDADVEALLSEFAVQDNGAVTLRTTPAPGRGALRVQLGTAPFARKLQKLRAFWQQAVLPQPDTRFKQVDLRFAGQVVTHEEKGGE